MHWCMTGGVLHTEQGPALSVFPLQARPALSASPFTDCTYVYYKPLPVITEPDVFKPECVCM